jgi:hypothetical protein
MILGRAVLVVLVGLLVSCITGIAAFVAGVTGVATGKRERGIVLSGAALGLALFTALASAPVWVVVLRGSGSRGETMTWRDDNPLYLIVIAESALVLLAVIGLVRQSLRQTPAAPTMTS